MTSDFERNVASSQKASGSPNVAARRRHKQILKCSQCRLDKQKCTPCHRVWPARCDRCIRYNHTCSPGLNARDERRRQNSPSSYALSFRTPTSPGGNRIDRMGERFNGQYAEGVQYYGRTTSPETASSTTSSEDEQIDYSIYSTKPLDTISMSGSYHSTEPRRMSNTSVNMNINTGAYLDCPPIHPDLRTPVTPTTPYSAIHSSPEHVDYSSNVYGYSPYYPNSAIETPQYSSYTPQMRQRSGVAQALYFRFTELWVNFNPAASICSQSPKLARAFQQIFNEALQLAETDDMVDSALMAFSAADASVNMCAARARELRVIISRNSEQCKGLISRELQRFKTSENSLVSGDYRGRTPGWDIDLKATRLSLFLLLCCALCISDIPLMQLTSHHLRSMDNKISAHQSTQPSEFASLTVFPITSIVSPLNRGWRVHLFAAKDNFNSSPDEEMLEIGHDTTYFDDLRRSFEHANPSHQHDITMALDGEKQSISSEHRPYNAPCQVSAPTPTPRRTPTPSGNDRPASPPMGLMDINFAALSEEININSNLHYNRIGDYASPATKMDNTNNGNAQKEGFNSTMPPHTYTHQPPMLMHPGDKSPTAGLYSNAHLPNHHHHSSSTSYIPSRVNDSPAILPYSYTAPHPQSHSSVLHHEPSNNHGQYMYPISHTSDPNLDPMIMQKHLQHPQYPNMLQHQNMHM